MDKKKVREIAKEYRAMVDGGGAEPATTLSRKYGIPAKTIQTWDRKLRIMGDVPEPRIQRTHEQKLKIAAEYDAAVGGAGRQAVLKKHGLGGSSNVLLWRQGKALGRPGSQANIVDATNRALAEINGHAPVPTKPYSMEDKRRIVAEYEAGVSVIGGGVKVLERYGISSGQIWGFRAQLAKLGTAAPATSAAPPNGQPRPVDVGGAMALFLRTLRAENVHITAIIISEDGSTCTVSYTAEETFAL